MIVREFIKGRRTNYDAPADIGTRPVRSRIVKRVCINCKHYVAYDKYCPILGVGSIKNPNAIYCSWYKGKAL